MLSVLSLVALAAPIALTANTPTHTTIATANTLQAYTVPQGCLTLQLKTESTTADAYLQWTGTDGAAKSATAYLTITAGLWHEWAIPDDSGWFSTGTRSIYVAVETDSTSVNIQCMNVVL